MKRNLIALPLFVLCALFALPARADAYPDYLTLGAGDFDFDKYQTTRRSIDYRIEYRSGFSILPHISGAFDTVDKYAQIHPTLGFEGNSRGSVFGNGGVVLDVPVLRHGIITVGEAVGAYDSGYDRSMGCALQFRATAEVGWRFDNNLRMTAYISHISDGYMTKNNPGAEIVGAYVHVPFSWLEDR